MALPVAVFLNVALGWLGKTSGILKKQDKESVSSGQGMGLVSSLKLAVVLMTAGGIGGVYVLGRVRKASRRRRLERTRRMGGRVKQCLADVSIISGGLNCSIRILQHPRHLPAVTSSLVHLTLPKMVRIKPEICLERTNTYFVVGGTGVALIEGEEVPIAKDDKLVFTPGSSYYIANSSWNVVGLELMWLSDPAAPTELLTKHGLLVERYEDGASATEKALRLLTSGVGKTYNVATTGLSWVAGS